MYKCLGSLPTAYTAQGHFFCKTQLCKPQEKPHDIAESRSQRAETAQNVMNTSINQYTRVIK